MPKLGAVISVVSVVILTACGSASSPTSPSIPVLDGTSWVVTHIAGTTVVSTSDPTITFRDGTASGTTGCNRFTSTYSQDGATVHLTEGAMTQMWCSEDLSAQEAAFGKAQSAISKISVTQDGIDMLSDDGQSQLRLSPQQEAADTPLEKTTWQLSELVHGETASSPVADSVVTITITINDSVLSGKACNSFRGPATVDGTSIRIGPLAGTKMACPTDAESTQETTVMSVLANAESFLIEQNRLRISSATGESLGFVAQPS